MQHAPDRLSHPGAAFVLNAIASGIRTDGRRLHELRPLAIAFGADGARGSVQVRLGETKVLATATAELIEPYPDRPTEGVLQFFVEFSPMASPAFEPGRPSEAAIELMRLLERSLRKSQAIDVEGLCVVAGKHVWAVRVDVTVLDHRGNLTDAATLAALAALKHLRLPAVAVAGSGESATATVLPADQGERQPLVFHHTPVAVSLAFFDPPAPEGGAVRKGGTTTPSGAGNSDEPDKSALAYVVDPSDHEELVAVGSVTAVLNQHQELCALHKPGGVPLETARFMQCVQRAALVAPQLLQMLEEVLEQHKRKLAEAAEHLRRTGRTLSAPSANVGAGPTLDPAHDPAVPVAVAPVPPPVPPNVPSLPAAPPVHNVTAPTTKKRPAADLESDEEEETTVVTSAFSKAAEEPQQQSAPKGRKEKRQASRPTQSGR